ncbi:hypothetical protein HYC85_015193 [Camellia sinensis]|uniref:Uncharacterized protein n=1 Tax=Camellia sinensis TaxID=4442 RepID=A0A7J7HBS9_CAMSI|nr:hypothetical protein HYC85_015193 [Camellia sinensis]
MKTAEMEIKRKKKWIHRIVNKKKKENKGNASKHNDFKMGVKSSFNVTIVWPNHDLKSTLSTGGSFIVTMERFGNSMFKSSDYYFGWRSN